ncbi:MAG TPA: beta-galactosidase, partial [bacterium]|nr:beta-galactosidase [bacterium]
MRLATFALSAVLPVLTMPSFLSLAEDRITVQPQDNGRALVNPFMGWTFHHYSNIITNYGSKLEPSDTLDDFPGLSVIYLRLPWAFIEEEEGVFNWSIVDTPAQRWIDKGLRVAFRFTCSESWMEYATPRWVEQAGAKGYRFTPGKGTDANGPYWEPDFNDPIFLEKLEHFLAAAARRYDGHPDVDFIDVGSMGVWGEAHTFASTRINYSFEVIKKHIDLYT